MPFPGILVFLPLSQCKEGQSNVQPGTKPGAKPASCQANFQPIFKPAAKPCLWTRETIKRNQQ